VVHSGKRRSKRLDNHVVANWSDKLVRVLAENEEFHNLSHQSQLQRVEVVSRGIRARMHDLTGTKLPEALAQVLANALEALNSDTCEVDVVCYGIGSLCSHKSAQLQMAALLLVLQSLDLRGRRFIYDPVMNQVEQAVVTSFGFEAIGVNEEAKRCIRQVVCGASSPSDSESKTSSSPVLQSTSTVVCQPASTAVPTIFYMPHCGRTLSNNVLWANWGSSLSKVLLLGNCFSASVGTNSLLQTMNTVMPFVTEQAVPDYENAFNDMCLHTFRVPQRLWAARPPESIMTPQEGLDPEILTADMMTTTKNSVCHEIT